jgi:ABC-type transporter Mla subunit MlaD
MTVRDQMRRRGDELREQLRVGEQRLRELDDERAQLQQTLLRIAGAAQVLEELLATTNGDGSAAAKEVTADA